MNQKITHQLLMMLTIFMNRTSMNLILFEIDHSQNSDNDYQPSARKEKRKQPMMDEMDPNMEKPIRSPKTPKHFEDFVYYKNNKPTKFSTSHPLCN